MDIEAKVVDGAVKQVIQTREGFNPIRYTTTEREKITQEILNISHQVSNSTTAENFDTVFSAIIHVLYMNG